MSGNIVFSWLGRGDVKRNVGKDGPVADALLQLKPDKAVLLYPTASFEAGSDSPDEYQNFLAAKLKNDGIKIEVAVCQVEYRDESYLDAYTQAKQALEAEAQNKPEGARISALITGGMMQQGLIWVFLAKMYRLKLVACPDQNEPVQQLLAPIEPRFFASDNRSLANCQVFAWVAKPDRNSQSHHEYGAVAAWLEQQEAATASLRLLVDAKADQAEALRQRIDCGQSTGDPRLEDKAEIVQCAKSGVADTKYRISTVNHTDLTGIYYEALDFVESHLDTSLQPVFLVNGGRKENNLAWILLKILYPEARLIVAWKTSCKELSPDRLEYPHPVARMLSQTRHWFAASAQFRALPHDSSQMEEEHWKAVDRIWPWLDRFGRDPNVFATLKMSCGAFSYAGNGKNSPCLGTVLLLIGMALNDWGDFPLRLKTWLGSTWPPSLKIRLPAIEPIDTGDKARCYENLLCALHDFFKAALWDQNDAKLSTLQEIKVESKQLCLRLSYDISAIGSEGGTASPYRQLETELQNWKNLSVVLQGDAIVIRHGEKNG